MAHAWVAVFLHSSEVHTHDLLARSNAASQLSGKSASVSGLALVALGLALLTGLTLGQLTLVGSATFERVPRRATEATRTGLEFYDAVDACLASGQNGVTSICPSYRRRLLRRNGIRRWSAKCCRPLLG